MNQKLVENWRELLAKNIQFERERLGLTQKELASKVGLSSGSAITTWEKKDGFPQFLAFIQLCEIFERSPDELICEDLSRKSTEPPTDGKLRPLNTEGGELQESDVGASRATESPPPISVNAIEKQLLELMLEVNKMKSNSHN